MDETVVLIQARLGSRRLPGKVLLPLAGRPVLARVIERCRAAAGVARVVVATTEAAEDEAVAVAARDQGAEVFRGAAEDVLGRFAAAAEVFPAGHYVRVTADCPLLDSGILAAVLAAHVAGGYDFSYNEVPHDYPRGYDVEVLTRATLRALAADRADATTREHITPYLLTHPEGLRVYRAPPARPGRDLSTLRLVLDEEADYELLQEIFARLGDDAGFGLEEVLRLLEEEPALAEINRAVVQHEPPPPASPAQ
ncbi:MAG: NTP transferase domain-containing protein [Candidatus Coatesbacteria bacterium]|nr:MAG: NTP transferase domain-containing protein [Candidatus Coatesbacteria bacterium]